MIDRQYIERRKKTKEKGVNGISVERRFGVMMAEQYVMMMSVYTIGIHISIRLLDLYGNGPVL